MNASKLIDKQIAELTDWRGKSLVRLRKIIHDADPNIVEEWKWGTGVFSDKGMVCALSPFKDHVKLNFFKGASIEDPHKLFNAGLEAKATRAVDLYESPKIDEAALRDLIRAAVNYNKTKKEP
jgi:hypothetical protein